MENQFKRVTEAEEFSELVQLSQQQPVVIFKHSTSCGVSSAAYDEMEHFDGEVMLVEVQRARELSREIERRTGIRHETPQVLVLKNGNVVWNASHWKVKAHAVTDAVRSAE